MRWPWLLVAAAIAALISSCTTWLGLELKRLDAPRAALIEGIRPVPAGHQNAAFDQRVRAQFPTGTSEATLIRTLRGQHFRPMWRDGLQPQESGAVLTWGGMPCVHHATLRWRTDERGRVTITSTGYEQAACW